MNTLDLMKHLREIALQNGEDMSLKTAKSIVHYLLESQLIDKNLGSYGDVLLKTGKPIIK